MARTKPRARGDATWIPGEAWRDVEVRIAACEEVFGLNARIGRIRSAPPELARLREILAAQPVSGTR